MATSRAPFVALLGIAPLPLSWLAFSHQLVAAESLWEIQHLWSPAASAHLSYPVRQNQEYERRFIATSAYLMENPNGCRSLANAETSGALSRNFDSQLRLPCVGGSRLGCGARVRRRGPLGSPRAAHAFAGLLNAGDVAGLHQIQPRSIPQHPGGIGPCGT